MTIFIQILIFALVLPSFLLIISRWVFAFYYPANFGMSMSDLISRQPLIPSTLAYRIFNSVNTTFFLISFILISAIFALPLANWFYPFGLETSHIILIFRFLAPSYALWFLTLFTASFLYSRTILEDFFMQGASFKFYYVTLYENYNFMVELPQSIWKHLGLIFDNETKIQKRIELHKSIIPEYRKQKNKEAVAALNGAVKINEDEIAHFAKLRKKGGHLFVFGHNAKGTSSKILLLFIAPIFTWYITIVESFLSIFPALYKMYEKSNHKSPKP